MPVGPTTAAPPYHSQGRNNSGLSAAFPVAIGDAVPAPAVTGLDEWIGRDSHVHCEHLYRVVALGRFLIRPAVQCRFLASGQRLLATKRLRAQIVTVAALLVTARLC